MHPPNYLVELLLHEPSAPTVQQTVELLMAAGAEDRLLRHLASIAVVEDELCMALVKASSLEGLVGALERADLALLRVVPALYLPERRAASARYPARSTGPCAATQATLVDVRQATELADIRAEDPQSNQSRKELP